MEGHVKFVSSDKRLEQALEGVRTDPVEAQKFTADPKGYLEAKGIETKGLRFGAELSDNELEQVAGGAEMVDSLTICGSVGCIVCGSVGG